MDVEPTFLSLCNYYVAFIGYAFHCCDGTCLW